ncbi:MAG: SufE family protein [Bacteroidia bacterium]|nr:SufE family protein [Bacteroidia bacterium]
MSNLTIYMAASLSEREKALEEEFSLFGDDWELKYEHIIDKGKKLPPMSEAEKKEHWLVKGCQSRVWLIPGRNGNCFNFRADSDAIITKGIVAIILELLNNLTADEILKFDGKIFERIGLMQHLSPTRANGLVSMINTIKNYVQPKS